MGQDMTLERCKQELNKVFTTNNNIDDLASHDTSITCEWMVHPGYVTVGNGGCGTGADDFSRSPDREHEMSVLCSDELKQHLAHIGVELIHFDKSKLT